MLSIAFLILLQWSWQGRIYGILSSYLITAIICLTLIKNKFEIKLNLDKAIAKDILLFCTPLIPHALFGWVITGSDRLFINTLVGVSATGSYSAGYQIGALVGFLVGSFNHAWAPFLIRKLKNADEKLKLKIVQFTYLGFCLITLSAILVNWGAFYLIKYFLNVSYAESYQYVIWICFAGAFNGMYYLVANYIFYVEKTYILAFTTTTAALINVILNYCLIKKFGALGAAYSTTISYFVSFILVWICSMKIYRMPWFYFLNFKNGRVKNV